MVINMDHISRVQAFLEVAKHASFVGAAGELGMTGPALTKQVKALEAQLGVTLLHRTTRKVTLTEEGAVYMKRAAQALEDLQEAALYVQDMRMHPSGTLKVNVPMSFGQHYLAKQIALFAQQYPDVEMDIDFDDRHVDLVGEGYDVVVRIGAMADSSLIARKLADCPIILVATPALLEQQGIPNAPEQLSAFPSIIYNKHSNQSIWSFQSTDGVTGVAKLTRVMAANNADIMLEACLADVGIAMLPIFSVVEHIKRKQLVQVLPGYETSPKRSIYVLLPSGRYVSTRVRLFVDHLIAYAKTLPWVTSAIW